MKILCTGDLHIGRRSSRLPQRSDDRSHSAAACWERVVELALAESVAAVVVSGDLVDRANRFYEALGPLEAGVRRLAARGITTVAVAGNHDFDVLPRLAAGLGVDAFSLLGGGGRWERTTIQRDGQVLHIDGWSFPTQYVRENPVAAYDLPVPDEGPVLGLLHADLDQPGSPYAPVSLAELRARPVDFWLLGHIHAPKLDAALGAVPVLYPGSPQALDPGETGAHGVWLVEIAPGRRFDAIFVPLSSVRYEEIDVDLTGAADTGEVDMRVVDGLKAHLATVEDDAAIRCVSCRLRVVGRTPTHRELAAHLAALVDDFDLDLPGGASVSVEKVEIATRPAYALDDLARGNDPVGLLARLLTALDDAGDGGSGHGDAESGTVTGGGVGVGAGGGAAGADQPASVSTAAGAAGLEDEVRGLLREAERMALQVVRSRAYAGLRDGGGFARGGAAGDVAYDGAGQGSMPGDPALGAVVRRALADQAALLLDALLAQKEAR